MLKVWRRVVHGGRLQCMFVHVYQDDQIIQGYMTLDHYNK